MWSSRPQAKNFRHRILPPVRPHALKIFQHLSSVARLSRYWLDPWLCVPASRLVCHFRRGVSLFVIICHWAISVPGHPGNILIFNCGNLRKKAALWTIVVHNCMPSRTLLQNESVGNFGQLWKLKSRLIHAAKIANQPARKLLNFKRDSIARKTPLETAIFGRSQIGKAGIQRDFWSLGWRNHEP